jgi:hypothetical protein
MSYEEEELAYNHWRDTEQGADLRTRDPYLGVSGGVNDSRPKKLLFHAHLGRQSQKSANQYIYYIKPLQRDFLFSRMRCTFGVRLNSTSMPPPL